MRSTAQPGSACKKGGIAHWEMAQTKYIANKTKSRVSLQSGLFMRPPFSAFLAIPRCTSHTFQRRFARRFSDMAPSATSKTQPIVVSGPSGSGKSTLLTRLFKEYPGRFDLSVSHTTRAPRQGEQHGREYNFTTKDNFLKLVEEGGFIEHAQFGSNLYGTSVQAVKDVADKGRICVLDIEMEGVKSIKKTDLHPRYVFLQPPSVEILEQRLRGRGTDKEEAIKERLEQAKHEMEYAKQPGAHDMIIINDDLEKAWAEFREFCVPDE